MTAVVGILNKQAVAIAADSAVTIGGANGKKIFNRANKVFSLSKYHPVGVMIYNSASFMSTPWETIIKVYRKQLSDTSFSTLKEYQENFLSYLKAKQFFSDDEDKKQHFSSFANLLINTIVSEVLTENQASVDNPTEEDKQKFLTSFSAKIDSYIVQFNNPANFCVDFVDYTFEEHSAFADASVAEIIQHIFTNNGYAVNEELQAKIKQLAYLYLQTKETFSNFTGLIFTGFGEDEIYPSLIPVNISLAVGERLRYFIEENKAATISNSNHGAIAPFAQTDVISTILTGVDPTLDITYLNNFEAAFTKYNQELLKIIGDTNGELKALISSLDIKQLVNEYSIQNQQTKQTNYIDPLMNAVSNLSKEDLAEMAESLIYLTYLKRRITFAEESVGGPVDVAIISKGDGFIWIKRKHYFKPELNKQFFDNYFNK